MRILFFSILIYVFMVASVPHAQAAPTQPSRAELESQIIELLEQISLLQKLIAAKRASGSEPEEIYQTFFFSEEFEAVYQVEEGELERLDSKKSVSKSHAVLWSWFSDLVGEDAVETYIDEFRVYNDRDGAIGAFVEVKPRPEGSNPEWVLAVNEDDYLQNSVSKSLYEDLFVHEYAHILLYDMPSFTEEFTDEFWTSSDHRHSKRLADSDLDDIEDELEEYYEKREDEFVSDYATLNPDEDLAETFTMFVLEDKPLSSNIKSEEKILSFFQEPKLVSIRNTLRNNLNMD